MINKGTRNYDMPATQKIDRWRGRTVLPAPTISPYSARINLADIYGVRFSGDYSDWKEQALRRDVGREA